MAKSKRITLTQSQINSQDAIYDKLTKITFDDGAYTEINSNFRPSTIESCVQSLGAFLSEYEQYGGKVADDKEFYKFLYLHIVQYFSTAVPDLPTIFAEKLDLLNKLADNLYIIQLEEHFDPKQIEKVYEIIFKKMDAMQNMIQQNQKLRQQLLEKIDTMDLENKDIIKQAYFGEGV